ncbi:hypothetical protein [Pseudomonas chlororaphis]|uniref:hypothetical protein n=1 Tax=Pseudomonas chlororaphis TaxID=587753 RepID=UPI002407E96B|nr:hypothetical protein [Pseudomonas chlororaphis]
MAANQALRSASQSASSFIASKLRSYGILARRGCGTFLQAKKKTLNFKVFFKFGAPRETRAIHINHGLQAILI